MLPINDSIKTAIDRSVLCWLATASADNLPNVSPKEVFAAYRDECILIANIASPRSVKNIGENDRVCLSFIDIFTQRGYQLKGNAEIVRDAHPDYAAMRAVLEKITQGKFPFASLTKIAVTKIKPLMAPSYFLFPDSTERDRIEDAKRSYGVSRLVGEGD
ncbi:MAG: pyridoxamine 5'-phosphate oxidase family protein [Bacteroidota bacterium]